MTAVAVLLRSKITLFVGTLAISKKDSFKVRKYDSFARGTPEKGVLQIAICVPKLYHNLEKWVEIEVFSPHFVVHMWYTFRFRVPKLGILFQTKKC